MLKIGDIVYPVSVVFMVGVLGHSVYPPIMTDRYGKKA
jgi:hypothetical protein